MNTIRMIAVALPMMLLIACGGGGGGGTAAAPTTMPPTNMPDPMTPPTPNPLADLADFESSTGHLSIQEVSRIATPTDAILLTSNVAEMGNFGSEQSTQCNPIAGFCVVASLPNDDPTSLLTFRNSTSLPVKDISLIPEATNYFSNYTSMVTSGVNENAVTLARGRLTGMRIAGHPIEVQTFAGWLDGSVFGTTQILPGASGSEEYRFVSYIVGVYDASTATNPTATGSETSATWEGSAVASKKSDRTFILGDAEITVNFTDANVDLMFDNWRDLENQNLTSMQPITYEDLTLTSGAFEGSGNEQVEGRFYGDGHTEVGGFFNTMDVTGAFGGTRQ